MIFFMTPYRRVALAAIFICALLCCYLVINRSLDPKVDFLLPVDTSIPFLPWTIFVYQSLYAMVMIAAYMSKPREFLELMGGMVAIHLCCYVCFYVWTAHYPRPSPTLIDSLFFRALYTALHEIDGAGNTFPSIHASASIFVGWRMRQMRSGWGWPLWGVVVALSTLTVKQHFVVDIAAGGFLAAIVLMAVGWRRPSSAPPLQMYDAGVKLL